MNAETNPQPLHCPHGFFPGTLQTNGALASLPPAFSSIAIGRLHLLHKSSTCKLPQVIADGARSLAKLLTDASYSLLAIHPQCSKNPHTNRTCHDPKSIGIDYSYCGIFRQPCFAWDCIGHCRRLLSAASLYIQIICTIYFLNSIAKHGKPGPFAFILSVEAAGKVEAGEAHIFASNPYSAAMNSESKNHYGIALIQKFVRQHNGTMTINSENEEWSLSLTIPLTHQANQTSRQLYSR